MRFIESLFSRLSRRLICVFVYTQLFLMPLCSASVGGNVAADDPRLAYLGAWQSDVGGAYTVYGGSQIKLILSGQARLQMRAGTGKSLLLAVRDGPREVWRGTPPETGLVLDSGSSTSCFSVIYVAARKLPVGTGSTNLDAEEWRILNMTLEPGAMLFNQNPREEAPCVEFLGDSITSGDHIHGRSGDPLIDADSMATYAFILAESMGVSYRIRGYPGASARDVREQFAWFKAGVPMIEIRPDDLVFINLGANKRQEDYARFFEDMKQLVDSVRAQHCGVKIVLLNFFRMTPNRMPSLVALAKLYPHDVYVFDARPYLVGYSDSGVHPDVVSHRKLAFALADYVKRELFRSQVITSKSAGP
jgi:hypothetical protein